MKWQTLHLCLLGLAIFYFLGTYLHIYIFYGADGVLQMGDEDKPTFFFQKVLALFCYFTIAGYTLFNLKKLARLVLKNPAIFIFFFFSLLSVIWSVDRPASMFAVRQLFLSILVVSNALIILGYERTLKLVAVLSGVIAICSFAFPFFEPDISISRNQAGQWSGVFSHKNTLGMFACVISGLFFMEFLIASGFKRLFWLMLFGLTMALLYFSQSATSSAAFALTSAFLLMWVLMKQLRIFLLIVFPLIIIIGIPLGYVVKDEIIPVFMTSFKKDSSLTGRTDIWSAVLDSIKERPVLGHGYKAFWGSEYAYSRFTYLDEATDRLPAHSHNQFLDIAIDGGFIGFVLFVVMLVSVFAYALRRSLAGGSVLSHYPLYFFFSTLIIFMAEVPLLGIGFMSILFLIVSLRIPQYRA